MCIFAIRPCPKLFGRKYFGAYLFFLAKDSQFLFNKLFSQNKLRPNSHVYTQKTWQVFMHNTQPMLISSQNYLYQSSLYCYHSSYYIIMGQSKDTAYHIDITNILVIINIPLLDVSPSQNKSTFEHTCTCFMETEGLMVDLNASGKHVEVMRGGARDADYFSCFSVITIIFSKQLFDHLDEL